MKREVVRILLVALLAALLGACGQPPATATPEPTQVPPTPTPRPDVSLYQDQEFTVEYPAAWEVVEKDSANAVLFVTSQTAAGGPFRENVGVTRQPLVDAETTVDSYTAEFLAAAPDMLADYQLLSSEAVTLAGLPAQRVIYTGSQTGVALQWLQVWTVTGGSAYILTYTAEPGEFDTFLPDADALIASFTLP